MVWPGEMRPSFVKIIGACLSYAICSTGGGGREMGSYSFVSYKFESFSSDIAFANINNLINRRVPALYE